MNTSCRQCGAALAERDAFCTNCGARREARTETAAAQRFCTNCGAALAPVAKFCTKCGAAFVAPTRTTTPLTASSSVAANSGMPVGPAAPAGAPAVKSPAGIAKAALIGIGVVVLMLILAIGAGVIGAIHRAPKKAQEMEATEKFQKNLAKPAAAGTTAAQNGNGPSAADVNKSLNDLASALNAITDNAEKQSGANLLKGIAGSAGSKTETSPAGLTTAPKAQGNQNNYAAFEALNQLLQDLEKDAPDSETRLAVNDLRNRLNHQTSEAQRQATGPEDRNQRMAGIIVAVSGAATKQAQAILAAQTPPPMVALAATGNQAQDWALKYERTVGGPEADLVVRTGDINNLGFGWPKGFDPFSGQSTPVHRWPWPAFGSPPFGEPQGTDRIMIGSGVFPGLLARMGDSNIIEELVAGQVALGPGPPDANLASDGYSGTYTSSCPASGRKTTFSNDAEFRASQAATCIRVRQETMPQPIVLLAGALPAKINAVLFQVFADDFQASTHSHFQVSLNGTRIPSFEYAVNSIDQSGPIGKLLTFELLPEYWPLLKSGNVKLLIDDPTTHVGDGYAVDFVRMLVNPGKFKYQVSLTATVSDADTHQPITGATVTAGLSSTSTNQQGKCELKGIPAGLVVATANAPGYDENSVPVDLPAGQTGNAAIQLHRHQESTAALEQSIAQTGTATIYGIHFDTGSSKLRADSMPALNAVLGLIKGRPGSKWIIAGHTDNQGSDALNIPLSKARAASVISWLTAHGITSGRLEPEGFGSTRPVADNATASGRALNRRVEVALAN